LPPRNIANTRAEAELTILLYLSSFASPGSGRPFVFCYFINVFFRGFKLQINCLSSSLNTQTHCPCIYLWHSELNIGPSPPDFLSPPKYTPRPRSYSTSIFLYLSTDVCNFYLGTVLLLSVRFTCFLFPFPLRFVCPNVFPVCPPHQSSPSPVPAILCTKNQVQSRLISLVAIFLQGSAFISSTFLSAWP